MRVFDLYLGREVALPERAEAGRFRFLRSTVLNGRVELAKDEVLLSDGRERCLIGAVPHVLDDSGYSDGGSVDDSQETQRIIVRRALDLLAGRIDDGSGVLPSPLLPPEMADALELNEFDEALREVIDRGHLDEIVRRPRFSMKYESELVDVSRVRRTAPGALERLAARSEDWHRRTITAVLPKRLLAMFSDDDWSIYENKVFARLLDRLERYLRRRLAEMEGLLGVFEGALKLDSAEGLDHRLRDRLCRLWGEAMESSEGVTKSAIDESKRAIEVLRSANRKVGLLRHSNLYKKVPRSAQVPTELRHTNILNHDQHYRHLKSLWHLHQRFNGSTEKTSENVFRERQRELDHFSLYLQTMIRRVLRDIRQVTFLDAVGGFVFAGYRGCLDADKGEISLQVDGRELVFIPVLGSVPQIDGLKPDGSGRLIVSRISPADRDDFTGLDSIAKGRVFSLNPLDFYGEEKIRSLVERFLWFPAFKSYGIPIDRLPSGSADWLVEHSIGVVEGSSWRLICPLSDEERTRLNRWLETSGLNADSQAKISRTVQQLAAIGSCRHCGSSASFDPRDGAFKAHCASCNTEWGIHSTTSGRVARMKTCDYTNGSFSRFGSWCLEFPC